MVKSKLPKMAWIAAPPLPTGSRQWVTRDGMFKLTASELYEGIVLPRLWVLWQFKRGSWWKAAEHRSRAKIERMARERLAELESDE